MCIRDSHWWMPNRSDIDNYEQFKSLFKAKYWSETTQNLIRDNIFHGRYKPQVGSSMTAYFLGKVCMAKHLEPAIPEECLINKLSYHYDEEVIRARTVSYTHLFYSSLLYKTFFFILALNQRDICSS